jgi:hypothetical protein
MILPLVLYGCETSLLILRKEHGLRVFENRVLRKIFGPKWDEVTVEWRRLHTEELNDVYSPNIIWLIKSRRTRLMGHIALWERVEVYTEFWWGNQKERPHGTEY